MSIQNQNPYESPQVVSRPVAVPVRAEQLRRRDLVFLAAQLVGVAFYLFFLHWFIWGPPEFIATQFLAHVDRRNDFFYTEASIPLLLSFLFCVGAFGLFWHLEGKVARRVTLALAIVVALPFLWIVGIRGFDAIEVLLQRGR